MNFDEYQTAALMTAVYPRPDGMRWVYPALGLANEAGEVLGKLKKILRDKDGVIGHEDMIAIKKELGDALWYLAVLAAEIGPGIFLDDIATANVDKLKDRAQRGTLKGSGDDR